MISFTFRIFLECRRTFIKEILESKPLTIRIKGLEYMNDDPSNVDVLYAKIEASSAHKIQAIADKLMAKFVESGLSKKQYDRVKLHATVMNSLLTKEDDPTADRERNKSEKTERESFDARNVLRLFGDFDFGQFDLNEIHLSIRYSSGKDSYYDFLAKITL